MLWLNLLGFTLQRDSSGMTSRAICVHCAAGEWPKALPLWPGANGGSLDQSGRPTETKNQTRQRDRLRNRA